MITAVWMSPDRMQLFVQFGEDSIAVLDARYEQLLDLGDRGAPDRVPVDAEALFEPETQGEE